MANKKFQYKALDSNTNDIIRGKTEAPSEFALEQILRESNLTLISAREIKQSKLMSTLVSDRITTKDLITLFVHLEQLERAGVPLIDSIEEMKDHAENQKIRDISQDMYESIKGGKLLSEAMEKHKKIFGELIISLVAIGEKTGNLDESFKNICDNLKWNLDLKKKTMKAIRYPIFSLCVMLIVTIIMLKVVVPKVMSFIISQDIPVPFYTVWLLDLSDFVSKYGLKVIFTIIGTIIGIKFLGKNKKIGKLFDGLKLKIPLIGTIIQKIELSRFTKFFGVTFSSGVPILECLRISGSVVKNKLIRYEIERVKQQVSDGRAVSIALERCNLFPSLVIRMFKVGEESGNIKEAMENIDYFYEFEINDGIDKIVGSIQPALIFVMGGLMAWVVAAVFGPIYGNFSNMNI